jgi:MerR family copper efflux transcriptional regulator
MNIMSEINGFSIKQTSEQVGLTEDTIRYYEKIGLLPRAERKANGHRIYRSEDINSMKFILCLKKAGMSLDDMKPYMHLSYDDDLAEFPELYRMLQDHKKNIENQIGELQIIVDFINIKLNGNVNDSQIH